MRLLTRDELAVFLSSTYGLPLSVTFVRPDQAAAHRKATLARPGDRTSIV